MEKSRTRTVVLPDRRGSERFLRITWHPDSSTVVFSHWSGEVCTASTPVTLTEASRLIELISGAQESERPDQPDGDEEDWTAPTLRRSQPR